MPRRVSEEAFCDAALATLERYAAIPCLSPAFDDAWAASGHVDEAMTLFANWAGSLGLRGVEVSVRRIEGRTPLLMIDVPASTAAAGTVVLYGHLDKQPALGEWSEGLAPFTPVRRDDRLYARGVADDGYAMFAALLGIQALERDGLGHARCVVLIEASEESGSPDLEAHLDELQSVLGRVDVLVCLDSGALTYDRLWVTTSLRGLVTMSVTVEVMRHGVHSGSAGGVVPSSFRILRELLDRVENARTGEVLLRGLHAEIPVSHLAAAGVVAKDLGDPAGSGLPLLEGLQLKPEAISRGLKLALAGNPGASILLSADLIINSSYPIVRVCDASGVRLECRVSGSRRLENSQSRFRGRIRFLRIDELLNLRPFFVDFAQVFCTQFLVDREFLLGLIFLADVNVVGAEAVMRVR